MSSDSAATSGTPQAADLETARPEVQLCRADLEGLHVLRNASLDNLWGLLSCCNVRTLSAGEVLLTAGQSNRTLFMVLSGRLSVHLESAQSEPVAFVDAGSTVGELSVIDDSKVTAYVIALAPSRLLAVDEEAFWRLVTASHEFATNLLVLLAQRMRANNATLSSSEKMRKQFEREATIDGLTGLYNRRWLDERLARLVQRYARSSEPLSILMVDIDHFKRFNDQFGHLAGDRVLEEVAQAIQRLVRPTDVTARYGGEEMMVLLPDTTLPGALRAAERLRQQVEALSVQGLDGKPLPVVTISLGGATLEAGDTAQTLVERADSAMYSAKRAGRNRVQG